MSSHNRYYFTKNVYPKYIVLLIKKDYYYSFGKDREILILIGFKNKMSLLKKKRINYVVLDNLDIVREESFPDNNYDKYMMLMYLGRIFDNYKVIMSQKRELL